MSSSKDVVINKNTPPGPFFYNMWGAEKEEWSGKIVVIKFSYLNINLTASKV